MNLHGKVSKNETKKATVSLRNTEKSQKMKTQIKETVEIGAAHAFLPHVWLHLYVSKKKLEN